MEWKIVALCPAYEINRDGAVRRIDTGRIKKAVVARNGYPVFNLWQNNKGAVLYQHRLLAEAFIGPCQPGWTVNHIDGNKLNNALENLEYLTAVDNIQDMWTKGRGCSGERNGHSKLTKSQAQEICARANAGERTCDLAKEFGVGSPIVSQIKHGTRWKRHAIAMANLPS